jgi:cobalt-zinc-cadmium efflux system outer membrane protein
MRQTLLGFLLLGLASATGAQEPALTLEQAIAIARQQNPGLLAAQRAREAARAGVQGAGALANPVLSVTPAVTKPAPDLQLQLFQSLEIFGQRTARTRVARAHQEVAEVDYRAVELALVRDVKKAYYDALAAHSIAALNQDLLTTANALRDAAQRKFDVGSAPQLEVIKTEVEVTRAEQDLVRA